MHVNGLKQANRDPNPQVSDVNVPKQGVRIRTEKEFSEEETYGAKIKGPRAVPAHAASHFWRQKARAPRGAGSKPMPRKMVSAGWAYLEHTSKHEVLQGKTGE